MFFIVWKNILNCYFGFVLCGKGWLFINICKKYVFVYILYYVIVLMCCLRLFEVNFNFYLYVYVSNFVLNLYLR